MGININKIKEEYSKNDKGGDFETLPVGKYECFVFEMEGGVSKNDNPKIDITMKIADGDNKNRRLWTTITLTAKAWWKAEEFFEAVGYDIDKLPEEAETPQEIVTACIDDILGSKVKLTVDHRTWNGKTRENVKKVEKSTGGTSTGDDGNKPVF